MTTAKGFTGNRSGLPSAVKSVLSAHRRRSPIGKMLVIATLAAGSLFATETASTQKNDAAGLAFSVGYYRIEITPPVGIPLSGYYSRRAMTGVLDPLYATCLAFSDGTNRALVVAVDNLQIADSVVAQIKEAVTAKTKLPPEAMFIHASHIHTGPSVVTKSVSVNSEDATTVQLGNAILISRLSDGAKYAFDDLAPAKMLIGRGEAKGISFIRRYKMKDGTTQTNPGVNNPNIDHPIGKPDEQVQLVRFVREGKKEIALMNFQCHPDVISGTKCSADWPGLSARLLEKAFDGEINAVLINGAQGDTNHIQTDVKKGEVVPKRYEMSKHMARTIVGAALQVWGKCVPVPAGRVSYGMRQVRIESHRGKPEELPLAHKYVELHKAGKASEIPAKGMQNTTLVAGAYRMVELEHGPDHFMMPVSSVSIGTTLAFAGFPGEPFTWMGTETKAKSPFLMTVPACTTNGSRGYFPVESAYAEGGYEAATSRFAPGSAERLVVGQVEQLKSLYSEASK